MVLQLLNREVAVLLNDYEAFVGAFKTQSKGEKLWRMHQQRFQVLSRDTHGFAGYTLAVVVYEVDEVRWQAGIWLIDGGWRKDWQHEAVRQI